MKVDYRRDRFALGDAATNYQLMPGDRIYVGSRHLLDLMFSFDRFRVARS